MNTDRLLNGMSDYLSKKSPYYRNVNNMHEKMNPWVKAVHGLAVISLAVTAACQKIGITPIPTETYSKPTPAENFPATEIPSTPDINPGVGMVQFLEQDEVLDIAVARTTGGELIPLSIFFESTFKQDQNIKDLFTDPDSIQYSAMGIRVYSEAENRTVVYPFLSAVSTQEGIGFTAMVLVPEPGLVVAPILNRIVDANGIVGLGITQDIYTGEDLEQPVVIFSTGLTEAQIDSMTHEEIAKLDVLFVPSGVSFPYDSIGGAGKVNAIVSKKDNEPGLETMDRPLEIISYYKVEGVKVEGIVVNGAFNVDTTALRNDLHEVTMPNSLGGDLLLKVAAWLDWYHGNSPHSNIDPTDADITAFAERLALIQGGGEGHDASEVQSTIFAFDANQPGTEMQPMTIALFPGEGEVPAGVRRIDNVEIVYVSGYEWNEEKQEYVNRSDMPRFTVVYGSGIGFETEVDGSTLRFKIGPGYTTDSGSIHGRIPGLTLFLEKWIEKNTGTGHLNLTWNDTNLNAGLGLKNEGFIAR